MTLNNVLSAVRTLILDEEAPTGSIDERHAALRLRFPELADAEIADLATIPPRRLNVYTDLVFAGERELLRWVYPVTFAVLHRLSPAADDDPWFGEADFDLVRAIHRFRAWKIGSTRMLAQNMADFVSQHRRDWVDRWGGLIALIDCERVETDVFYAPDVDHQPMDLPSLADLSVDELMALEVAQPSFVALRSFSHDVLTVQGYWREHEKLPDDLPPASRTDCCCSRNPHTLDAQWTRLPPAGLATLQMMEPDRPYTVESLAEVYVDASSDAERSDEPALFASFFDFLTSAGAVGVLLDARNSRADRHG